MSDLKDMDGNTVSLLKLCSLEPEWARSRIEILQAKVEQLEAELIMIFDKVEYSLNYLGLKGVESDEGKEME